MQAPHGPGTGVQIENPVPGPIGQVLQFGFNLPAWVQLALAGTGMVVGAWIVWQAWTRRVALRAWFGQRSRGYQLGIVAIGLVALSSVGAAGYAGNHYMQHDNDFCMSCHVMGDAWNAFQQSEHRKLECHACHRQGMVANARQLYFWIAERPDVIPDHAGVPTKICAECHVQNRADSSWKRIVRTAGHRLHMESDSSALKDVACVTCHGQEVHRFKSVDKTCGQSGCHDTKDTKIVLGKMAGQSTQHCVGCHTFSRVVAEDLPIDTLKHFLSPVGSSGSCLGCHQMQQRMKDFSAAQDRGHQAVCGTCHNPHTQKEPKAAYESCATGGCHADLATRSPFHARSGPHKAASCGQCHDAHSWKPKGTQCVDCHKTVLKPAAAWRDAASARRGRMARGTSRTTARAVAHVSPRGVSQVAARGVRVVRDVRVDQPAATAPRAQPPKDSPTFSHRTHGVLACAGCHRANGALFVRTTADCAGCHHAANRPVACEGCHRMRTQLAAPLMRPLTVRTTTGRPARMVRAPFAHVAHRDLECRGCHTEGPLLAVTRDCASCHVAHHEPERACATCHKPALSVHARASHDGCAGAGCHSNASVLALPATRTVCQACHAAQQHSHYPRRECADCHAVHWTPAARPSR